MSMPPTEPPVPPRKELTSALVWTLGAVVVAILAFTKAADRRRKTQLLPDRRCDRGDRGTLEWLRRVAGLQAIEGA